MSKSKKIFLSIILSLLFAGMVFCILWLCKNFNVVKQAFSGTQLYTKVDIDNAYADGKKDGLDEKNNNYKIIDEYKSQVVSLQALVNDYENQIEIKENSIEDYKLRLESAEGSRDSYKRLLDTSEKNNVELQSKYDLECSKVASLKTELNKLKEEKTELQTNLINAQNRISELNQTVIGYENFIQGLLAENQVVAKFYYDNSLYSVMVLQKGDKATISNPADTTYKKFLGWMVDNEIVDVANYPINENTTFIAKINKFNDVLFTINGIEYDSDTVLDGSYSKVPTPPTKDGYEFLGWSIDNTIYDVNTYPITSNTVFEAKFVKINTVSFSYKENVINTQTVRTGEYASVVYPDVDDHTQFNYWMVDGIRVDIETYVITSDVVFVANTTNLYDVKFIYEDREYNSQIIADGSYAINVTPTTSQFKVFKGWSIDKEQIVNVEAISITGNTTFYAVIDYYYVVSFKLDENTTYGNVQLIQKNNYPIIPINPTKDGYEFDYWTLDKATAIDVSSNKITMDTIYYAKFTKLHNVAFKYEDNTIATQLIRDNEYASVQSVDSTERKVFNGWTVNGNEIIDLGTYPITTDVTFMADISYRNLVQFKLGSYIIDKQFVEMNKFANAPNLSSYSSISLNNWVLDGNIVNLSNVAITRDMLFVGDYSVKISGVKSKTFNNVPKTFSENYVWHYNDLTYFSRGTDQYYLDIYTSTWKEKEWHGLSEFDGRNIWIVGDDVYYSYDSGKQYKLDIETDTWIKNDNFNHALSGMKYWFDSYYINDYYLYDSTNNKFYDAFYYNQDGKMIIPDFGFFDGYDWFVYTHENGTYTTYKLSKEVSIVSDCFTITCTEVTISGVDINIMFLLKCVYRVGDSVYYLDDSECKVFNRETLTFTPVDFYIDFGGSRSSFSGCWTDGLFYYCSNYGIYV